MHTLDTTRLLGRKRLRVSDTGDLPSILRAPEEPHEPLISRIKWNRVLVIFTITYLLVSFMYGAFSILDLKDQENGIRMEIVAAREEQLALEKQIAYLQTDEAAEQIAREQLGMVRPGEVLITQQETQTSEESAES